MIRATVAAMAKVVALHGARPGGWSKARWEWIGAVMADGQLSPLARLVAVALAQKFANHETAECRPGLPALMRAVDAQKRSVMRALADLQARGWIGRGGGNSPGLAASYAFLTPGQVPEMTPEQVPEMTPEQVPEMTPEQVSEIARTGANFGTPPRPPYKDKPKLNHKAQHPVAALRGLPMPSITLASVAPGSDRAQRWDEWLRREGYPPLERIGHVFDGQYRMPVTIAPDRSQETAYRIARRWADWLRSKA